MSVDSLKQKYGNIYETYESYDAFVEGYWNPHCKDDDVVVATVWLEDDCTLATMADNNHLDEIVLIAKPCVAEMQKLSDIGNLTSPFSRH